MKKFLKIIGVFVVLSIAALLAAPMFISADFLKEQLTAQVKNATGRDLTINGKTSLTLFPTIAVSAEDVTLGNPIGFKSPFFAQFKKFETGAALKPLLAKELRITGVTLTGAVVNLEQNEAGAQNWNFAGKKKQEKVAQPDDGSSRLKAMAIGDIIIKDSAISYAKAGVKLISAKDITLKISGADGSKALRLDGSALFEGEKIVAKLAIDKMKALMAGKNSPVDLTVALPASSLKFKGTAGQEGGLAVNGVLDVAIADLPKLTAWATGKSGAVSVPKKLSLKTNIAAKAAETVALNDLAFSADAIAMTGKLAFALGGVPDVKGVLSIPELDVNALKNGKAESPKNSPAPPTGWSDERMDFSALKAANANLDIVIGALKFGGINASDMKANITTKDGSLKLNIGNAGVYGGSAKGVVHASSAGVGSNLTFSGIDIEQLMTALSGKSRLTGKANFTLAVNGSGNSQRAIISTLNGNGSLQVVDGSVKGINIASFLRDAKKGFLFSDGATEKTDFTELTGTFQIAQGIVSNQDLSMKSPVLRLAGKGTVSLPPKTVNYRLEPTLVATTKGQGDTKDRSGITIPLLISGAWANPSITPDLTVAITDALKDPAKLKENLMNIKTGVKDFNSPSDIGAALLGNKKAETSAPGGAAAAQPTNKKQAKEQLIREGIGGLLNALPK